jgi:glucose/arabinose dehydrogenase
VTIPKLVARIVAILAIGAAALIPGASAQSTPFDPAAFAFALEPVADGFERPVDVVDAGDGSGRLFVVEQAGRMVFHPRYAENGFFFVDYTDENGDTQIVRYTVSVDDPDRADPASAVTILSVDQPAPNHNGGRLLFGADGYLYVGLGDGGGGNGQNGQQPDTLLGKILRIDVDREENGLPYAIPPDNPFAGKPDVRPEIWVSGLRNPWRMAFDRATGDLWIGDVGSSIYEEINLVPAGSGGGENFGWNAMEGFDCRDGDDAGCADFVAPVSGFPRGLGCVVTGGTVYRGAAVPALAGVYLFADYCGAGFWGLGRGAAGDWITAGPILPDHRIVSFGEDAAGELYAVDLDGGISRIVAA